ncbi:hypothetical protein [Haloarchaeobius sp. DFWS5]|uniref:hypothetical protein n=1 Tax=Haloarchaeobius sp. DFWS5 TaxID=3446114 RepID=UPI003EB7BA4E
MVGEDTFEPTKGDEYTHDDGTREIVFLVEDGRVLSVREYDSVSLFNDTIDDATYRGINHDVASLPEVDLFE